MKRFIVLIMVVFISFMIGCSKKTANERNFGGAVSRYLEKNGDLSLRINKWPVEVSDDELKMKEDMPSGIAGQMAVLETAGLVSGSDAEFDELGFFDRKPTGRKLKVKRYVLTEKGKKYYREKDVDMYGLDGVKKAKQGDIYYGKKTLDKIVKWEGPIVLGEYQEASVIYKYKIDGLADWAKEPEFQTAFPQVGQIIENAGKEEEVLAVKLTSEGWEH